MDVTNQHQPMEMYTSNRHPAVHYRSRAETKAKDPSSLYQDSPARLYKKHSERSQAPVNDASQVKWCRNNIALTMEYFEPISSTSTPKRYSNQSDYAYAYYEPGAAMRHSNIPKMPTDQANRLQSSTTQSSPKSIRSLLSQPKDDKTKPNNRHTFATRYGTQENIYEDVSTIQINSDAIEPTTPPLNARGSKIEFQDILHNHYRVLEELNLSVEELLLSTTKKTNALSPRKMLKRSTKSRTKSKHTNSIGSKNVFASSMNELVGAEDSGFSGSSSGASYIGGPRNYKTALTRSHGNSTEMNYANRGRDCGTSQGVINFKRRNESQTGSLQMIDQLNDGDKCSSGASKGLKFLFWNKR